MCVFSDCCGCQTLQQGLFIFAVLDVLIRSGIFSSKLIEKQTFFSRFFMMGLDVWSGAGTLGLDGLLFLADIGLAAGAKMEVTKYINLILQTVFVVLVILTRNFLDQIIDPDLDDCLRIPHPHFGVHTTNSHHIWLGLP